MAVESPSGSRKTVVRLFEPFIGTEFGLFMVMLMPFWKLTSFKIPDF